ncbi:MAG TPA: UDP-N-acetylmuramoyl-tripeptide--D-alanyl-D-alanine ligase [Actinomycetota bacterium]|nr:UDP-N-acetylmuramoyl-tripeptide--D-alanyl-D-alanine ligase [Actinomycetota bacterium]
MRPRRLSEVARATAGRVRGDDALVSAVVVDSRRAGPGALFVALRGERADGHAFVGDAFARGAAAALVRPGAGPSGLGPLVEVEDPGRALLDLAADERRGFDGPVIGVTGANGKTTTKELAAAVLGTRLRAHASPGSFNNEVGVPLTILGAPPEAEALVLELGARHVGDHLALCEVARPGVVVVTNVGLAHLEVYGSWEAIVASSAEPVEWLGPDGTAVLNADDPVVRGFAGRARGRVLTFGLSADADVRAEEVELGADGRPSFALRTPRGGARVHLPLVGEHMVPNALAAAACGIALGLDPEACAEGLRRARGAPWRMETAVTPEGVTVINDAYNANPESVAAALRAARWLARGSRLCAVLGHMAELGPASAAEHERVGELAARLRVDRLVTVGDAARAIARAAVREGLEPGSVAAYVDPADALADVRRWARAGDVVLCKASRVVGLERVAEALATGGGLSPTPARAGEPVA